MNKDTAIDTEAKAIQVTPSAAVAVQEDSWSVDQVVQQVSKIQSLLGAVMKEGEHYGKIPGCGDKKALLKSGAEKIALTFRLAGIPRIDIKDLANGHKEYLVTCDLVHIPTGRSCGSGIGSCSTMETKYRYRESRRKCPKCNAESIIKGKTEYGGGWLCFAKKGGCGAKFKEGDNSIEGQQAGRSENPDIADTYNTVLKMAKKRAFVDAILSATAASDIFTQDIEDSVPEDEPARTPPKMPREKSESPVTESNPSVISEDLRRALFAKAKTVWGANAEEPMKRYMRMKFSKDSTKDLSLEEYAATMAWLNELAESNPTDAARE